jgi:hypothetical protein
MIIGDIVKSVVGSDHLEGVVREITKDDVVVFWKCTTRPHMAKWVNSYPIDTYKRRFVGNGLNRVLEEIEKENATHI